MPTHYAFDATRKRAWKFNPSLRWVRDHDNGFSVSIGFRVPKDVGEAELERLGAKEVDWDEYNHSGCGSSCVKRGAETCRW